MKVLPRFGRKTQPAGRPQLSRQDWERTLFKNFPCLNTYKQLMGAMGWEGARDFLDAVYSKRGSLDPVDRITEWMGIERDTYVRRKLYIDRLWLQAKTGGFINWRGENIRDTGGFYDDVDPTLAANPRNAMLRAIDQAANWITEGADRGSPDDEEYGTVDQRTPALGVARGQLKRILIFQANVNSGGSGFRGRAPLGVTDRMLRQLHTECMPSSLPKHRFTVRQATDAPLPYTSTAGGSALLRYIFQLTSNVNPWPEFGNAELWENYAMFYLASIGAAQGFYDGNKRASHLAYSIVLIWGTHAFRVPTTSVERDLFNMA